VTRQFLTDQAPQAQSADPVALPPAAPAAPAQKAVPQDALAGAFPAWDLLPATPFIRRVK
jgi:hypothetical protein